MLSDLFLEMMYPIMSKQRQRPYAVTRFISLRYDSSRSNFWQPPLVYTLCPVLVRIISIKGQQIIYGSRERGHTIVYNSFPATWQSSLSQQTSLPHQHSTGAGTAGAAYSWPGGRHIESMASWIRDPLGWQGRWCYPQNDVKLFMISTVFRSLK